MGKAFSGSAFVAACSIAAPFFHVAPARAQAIDVAALTQCLIDNTTEEHIGAMKRLMIAALQDDIATLKAEAATYGNIIVQMVVSNCNIQVAQLADPAVNEAVGKYGENLGAKIMTDAFAKIQ